jgi:hypothetical protein
MAPFHSTTREVRYGRWLLFNTKTDKRVKLGVEVYVYYCRDVPIT